MKRQITDFKQFVDTQPDIENALSAADIANLIKAPRSGKPVVAPHWLPSVRQITDLGSGRHEWFQFLGNEDRDAFERVVQLPANADAVFNEALGLLYVGGSTPHFIDLETQDRFDWDVASPRGGVTVSYPANTTSFDLNTADQTNENEWVFGVCYTYYNRKFGIESPASVLGVIRVGTRNDRMNVNEVAVPVTFTLSDPPAWADQVRYYFGRDPYGGRRTGIRVRGTFSNYDTIRIPHKTPIATTTVRESQLDGIQYHQLGSHNIIGSATFPPAVRREFRIPVDYSIEDGQYIPFFDFDAYENILPDIPPTGPPDDIEQMVLYAGRSWGYDPNNHEIVFSLIDEFGTSQYGIFPIENVEVPHAFNLIGQHGSGVKHMAVDPTGGLILFFVDAIRFLRGQSIVSGIQSIDLAPTTDIDASIVIHGIGLENGDTVSQHRGITYFVSADSHLYALSGTTYADIGSPIQLYLDDETAYRTTVHDSKLYVALENSVCVYDIQRKYWTRYVLENPIRDFYIDRSDDRLYAIDTTGSTFRLDTSRQTLSEWRWTTQEHFFDDIVTFSGVYVYCSPPFTEMSLEIVVDNNDPLNYTFIPEYNNRFLQGFYARGSRLKVTIKGENTIPNLDKIEVEYAT